jgi:drug/metabolite transporter (DMT)-like permease
VALLARVHFVTGDLLMLLAVMGWSVYSWLLARPPAAMIGEARPNWSWAEFLLVQVLFGLVFSAALTGAEQALTPPPVQWSGWLILALVYVAVGPSVLAYRSWGLGVSAAGPAIAAFFGNLTPLFAAVMSAALLGEWPQWFHGTAFVLIAAGIAVSSRR